MPTLMQKIRLALRGWSRRREEAQKEFVARNVGWSAPAPPSPAGRQAPPPAASSSASSPPDIDGLVVAFLDDSGRIDYYLDRESGEVIDVRDGATLPPTRFRRVPRRSEANETVDRGLFVDTLEPGVKRDALARASASSEEFRKVLGEDRSLERKWYSFKNDRVVRVVEAWLKE
jgi:hypothetical protein